MNRRSFISGLFMAAALPALVWPSWPELWVKITFRDGRVLFLNRHAWKQETLTDERWQELAALGGGVSETTFFHR